MDVDRISDSCGFAVPLYEYKGERSQLLAYAENKGPEAMEEYKALKNAWSIDEVLAITEREVYRHGPIKAGRGPRSRIPAPPP